MEAIIKKIEIKCPLEEVVHKFIHSLNEWWPEQYTWSQDKLKHISIAPKVNGLCTEIGPHGFRCDWGRVLELTPSKIKFTWQISPIREPVPDPDKASEITVHWTTEEANTSLELTHSNFDNHGKGAKDYKDAMASTQGWEYILNCFKLYCEKSN